MKLQRVMGGVFVSRFLFVFGVKLSSPALTQVMLSAISTFCLTNWARWHKPGYLKPICIQHVAGDFLSKEADTWWESNLASSTAQSQPLNWGQTAPVTASPLQMKDRSSLTSTCPLIFHALSAPCRFQTPLSSAPFSTSSFILNAPLFIAHCFHVICDSRLRRAEATLLSALAEAFIHYHIKGFLMPRWLEHCYCWCEVSIERARFLRPS